MKVLILRARNKLLLFEICRPGLDLAKIGVLACFGVRGNVQKANAFPIH